jgi:hypothetical protein
MKLAGDINMRAVMGVWLDVATDDLRGVDFPEHR